MAADPLFIPRRGVPVTDGIPVYSQDRYWGKAPESELVAAIALIDAKGFSAFDRPMQKKFDFTYDEDRADWRFAVPLLAESTVLDIGAGLGRISIPLARVAGRVVACDSSVSRMRMLSRRAKAEGLANVTPIVADVFDLPFKENSFDLIVMNGVLEWVGLTDKFADPRQAQIESLKIIRNLLKPGGRLYIGIENRRAMAYIKAADHGGLLYTGFMPRPVANLYSRLRGKGPYRTYTYTKSGYEKLIRQSGFETTPDFYLLYPGYNLPRIIMRYEDILSLKFLLTSFKPAKTMLRRMIFKLASLSAFIRAYRLFFYSFGIIVQK